VGVKANGGGCDNSLPRWRCEAWPPPLPRQRLLNLRQEALRVGFIGGGAALVVLVVAQGMGEIVEIG